MTNYKSFNVSEYILLRETLMSFRSKLKLAIKLLNNASHRNKLTKITDKIKWSINNFHIDRELIRQLDLKDFLSVLLKTHDLKYVSLDCKQYLQSAMSIIIDYIERDYAYKKQLTQCLTFEEGDFVRCNYYNAYGKIVKIQSNVNNTEECKYDDQIIVETIDATNSSNQIVTSVKKITTSGEVFYLQKIASSNEIKELTNKLLLDHFNKTNRLASIKHVENNILDRVQFGDLLA